ncbi:MAG: ribosome maturation factor RimM [Bdellovibrionaceae bacterium]|nr:ribosome maturation factor RimM [Pseudobdellovibrionaceae bacterium]
MDYHFLKLAYVSKSHGLKGEIFVKPFNPKASWPSISSVKIGSKLFSIEYYSAHKKGFIIKLKTCNTKQEADQLKTQPVFLNKQYFIKQKTEEIYLAEFLDFDVFILKGRYIGKIIKFKSDKYQDFLVLSESQNKNFDKENNILVPFTIHYIHKIDFEHKNMVLNLPKNYLSLFKKK